MKVNEQALRCHACAGPLSFEAAATPAEGRGRWGLMRCDCREHPVIDDIVVLTDAGVGMTSDADGAVIVPGPSAADLAARVSAGRTETVLSELLTLPPAPPRLAAWPLTRRAATVSAVAQQLRRARRPLTSRVLRERRDRMSGHDWFARTYRRSAIVGDLYNHFYLRFGQPRLLAALALLENAVADSVVDVCSGFGHLLHCLGADRRAIAIDQGFLMLWLNRWYIAPHALPVLADANRTLPLADALDTTVVCSDAFVYLRNHADRVADFARVAGVDGAVALARVGNETHPPHEGTEHDVDGWRGVVGAAGGVVRLFSEEALLQDYLSGRTADLRTDGADLANAKWLCALAVGDEARLRAGGPLPTPAPHHRGRVAVNPVYRIHDGKAHLEFPSDWYRFENEQMTSYMPQVIDLASLESGEQVDPEPTDFVHIGLPARY